MVTNFQEFGYSALFKKNVSCQISDIEQRNFIKKQILSVFTKSVVFHHIGLSWIIETKEQYSFAVNEHYE